MVYWMKAWEAKNIHYADIKMGLDICIKKSYTLEILPHLDDEPI